MKYSIVFIAILLGGCNAIKFGSKTSLSASIVKEGFIDCFEKGVNYDGKPLWCEASAIVYDGSRIIVANDKDMPDNRSSVFYWAYQNQFIDTSVAATYFFNAAMKAGKKYEDFALTPDGKYVFLTTAFDRIQPESKKWDGYNTVLYWKVGNEQNCRILSVNGFDSSSVSYRQQISSVLASSDFPQGPPYFKVEGLAATKDMLYWGIREEGKKYDDFKYKMKILRTPYHIKDGKVSVDSFTLFADIDIPSIRPDNKPIALSSIEYDHFNKRFLLLTSYEEKDKFGGYLWTASLKELQNGKLRLVKDKNGNLITFHNKCEDIAVISAKKIIVIHDDDRTVTHVGSLTRQPYQAAYSIVEFE